MSKNYKQLRLVQRYQIEALLKAGLNQKSIAEHLGVHASTVCREMKRNIACRGRTAKEYYASNAQRKTDLRHKSKPKHLVFDQNLKDNILKLLKEERWSPELISNCTSQEMVSHESIYKWIWKCKHSTRREDLPYKHLYKYLRHGRRRRKRGNYNDNRGKIPNRVSIDKRPPIVQKRKRIGDIEVDLMMGKNHQSALLVMTDRATLHTRLEKLVNKESDSVYKGIKNSIRRNRYVPKTFTFDNDKAFSCHVQVNILTGAKTFFTRPYTSQDKGTVENRIGTVRRFLPKKTDLRLITKTHVRQIETKLNNRPIRKFNYLTANQMLLKKIALIN